MSLVIADASTSRTPLKRERPSDDEDEFHKRALLEDVCTNKRYYYYVLAPSDSEESWNTSDESVHTVQDIPTDVAKDTSDTSTEDEVSEFDIVSDEGKQVYHLPLNESSSAPEDVCEIVINDPSTSDFLSSRKSSNSETERTKDNNLGKINKHFKFRPCIRCGCLSNYSYCFNCYKIKKNFFPPPPRRNRKRKSAVNTETSENSLEPRMFSGEISKSEETISEICSESGVSEGCLVKNDLCNTCFERPKDGGFCHDNTMHVYSCYKCSSRTLKLIGRCPICNRKVNQVCKVIVC